MPGEGAEEPRSREGPVALGGGEADVEYFGGFFHGESGEEAQFDQLGDAGVYFFEALEGFFEIEEGLLFGDACIERFIEGYYHLTSAAAFGRTGAGVVDEQQTQLARRYTEEMGSVFPLDGVACGEPQIQFVHQGGGLQRVARRFGLHVLRGEAAEIVVGEGEQFSAGGAIPASPSQQQGR